jgi:DNA-binding IclR family transcriptional regulator
MKPKPTRLSSTEKALKILMAFAPYNQEMGTLELSEKLNIHKSTVSRLLHLLTANGFLQQNPDNKKYLLGRAVAEIGNAVIKSLDSTIVSIAQPYLNGLSEKVGESVALEVVSGTNIFLAGHVEGHQHIRFSFQLGEQVPINVAAGAKAILAHSTPEFVRQCLKQKFERFNANTIVSKKEYRALLKEVQRTGVAYDHGERFADTHAVATPIFNHQRIPVAAAVIAGPAFRLTPQFLESVVNPLKQTANEISQRLFY